MTTMICTSVVCRVLRNELFMAARRILWLHWEVCEVVHSGGVCACVVVGGGGGEGGGRGMEGGRVRLISRHNHGIPGVSPLSV